MGKPSDRRLAERRKHKVLRAPVDPKFLFQGFGAMVASARRATGRRYSPAARAIASAIEKMGLQLGYGDRWPSGRRKAVIIGYGSGGERRRDANGQLVPYRRSMIDGLSEILPYTRRHIIRGMAELVQDALVEVVQELETTVHRGRHHWQQRRGGRNHANEYGPGKVLRGLRSAVARLVKPERVNDAGDLVVVGADVVAQMGRVGKRL